MDSKPTLYWDEKDAQALSHSLSHCGLLGVIFMDAGGHITGWSEGCCFIVGYEAQEVLGKHVSIIFTPEDRERRLDEHELAATRELGAAEDERWHLRKDGSRFWASGVTLPIPGDEGVRGYIKTFKDATHVRSRMKAMENEVRQAAKSTADRQFFLASIAHELRNPLAPLKAVSELLARQEHPRQQDHLLKIIDRQLGFLERLVEDLVDLARVETGKLQLEHHTIELQHMLRVALESCRDKARSAGIALHAVLPPVPIDVEVDTNRVHQVVINLLNNALKFTPSGGTVVLLANVDQTHFFVHVRDTGRGIDAGLLPKIFDMFTQAEDAGSQRGQGFGVGLALVKQIVSLHQAPSRFGAKGRARAASSSCGFRCGNRAAQNGSPP